MTDENTHADENTRADAAEKETFYAGASVGETPLDAGKKLRGGTDENAAPNGGTVENLNCGTEEKSRGGENGTSRVARGAAVLALGGLAAKVIGAIYRIPLTKIIGAEGIGLYQMVFPMYCAMLAFSSAGLPTALSKLVSESEKPSGILIRSLLLYGGLGLAGSAIMCVLGRFIAAAQGNADAALCYVALSPSVFAVSLISCLRGYFQGKNKMAPTAISQVVEQLVKTATGLTACRFLGQTVAQKAALAALAVTASEVAAFIFLYVKFKISGEKSARKAEVSCSYRQILAFTVPVAISAAILPLGGIIDSFIIINALGKDGGATAAFGIYSGSVPAITGVPVSVAYGIAAASVPAAAGGDENKIIAESMRFTGFVAFPFTLFFTFFSDEIVGLLYGGFSVTERAYAAQLLTVDSLSVCFLSFLQAANALLVAKHRQKVPVCAMGASLFVRAVACRVLIGGGIVGAAVAANLSYAVALGIDLAFAVPKEAAFGVLLDSTKNLFCALTCVLAGFLAYRAIGGALAFAVISVATAATYLVLAHYAGLTEGLFKRNNKIKPSRANN